MKGIKKKEKRKSLDRFPSMPRSFYELQSRVDSLQSHKPQQKKPLFHKAELFQGKLIINLHLTVSSHYFFPRRGAAAGGADRSSC